MKRRLASAALLGWLSLAAATNAPKLSLEQQAVRAEVIVRATVDAPATVQESGQTWTVYPLTILEAVAGDAQSLPKYQDKPSVWVLSGVQDAPSLPSGDTMLLLYKERYDSPLVGFNQGKYTLQSVGGAAAKIVAGLPDGTPGVASSAPPPPASTNPTTTNPAGISPASTPPAAPVTVAPATPGAAPAASTAPALAPASDTQANLAQADSVQASVAAAPVAVPPPAATAPAPANTPAPSAPAATPPVAPAVSEASATASASKAAPATPAPAPGAPALPPVPNTKTADKTTDSTPVPVPNAPLPNPPAAPPPANVAAPLQPGQMTLEAFRTLVLDARARAGK